MARRIIKGGRHMCQVSAALGCALVTGAASGGDLLPDCTLEFEVTCPDITMECGATFSGGTGCVVDFLPFCYSSGFFSYGADPDAQATIMFSGDVLALDMFFAGQTGALGTMRFFDVKGAEVGTPLLTNGECDVFMPRMQQAVFSTPVRSVVFSTVGGRVYVDSLRINPPDLIPGTPGDLTGDGIVDGIDLGNLLANWSIPAGSPGCGGRRPCAADLDDSGSVDGIDLGILLANWTL